MPTILGSKSRGLRWRGLLVAGCAVAATAGCTDTGFDAQTNAVYDPGIGSNARGGGVDVLNALIVDNGDGTGTMSATLVLNPAEFPADTELSTVTMNAIEVTTFDQRPVDSSLVEGGVILEPNEPVKLGDDAAATVSGDNFEAGDMVTVSIDFDQDAQPVRLDVPVVSREDTDMYDEVAEAR